MTSIALEGSARVGRVRWKDGRGRRTLREFWHYEDWHRNDRERRFVGREIDRTDADPASHLYRERIVSLETGEVRRHVDEPLVEHRGHGNAKERDDP